MLSKIPECSPILSFRTPSPHLELFMEDSGTSVMTTLGFPSSSQNWNLSRRTLWGGLVCGDYGCIPHRLVLKLFHTNRWRYSHSRVGIHYGIVISHLITGMKPLLLTTITLFHLWLLMANANGYLFHIRWNINIFLWVFIVLMKILLYSWWIHFCSKWLWNYTLKVQIVHQILHCAPFPGCPA